MVPKKIKCKNCVADIEVKTWRKYVKCPYCSSKFPFEGFDYEEIDRSGSMYAIVKLWMDCPACRSKNMYMGSSGRAWKCPDCGYTVSKKEKRTGVFWFCDDCEAYLNVQPGFTTVNKTWTCRACGHVNVVTKDNIM